MERVWARAVARVEKPVDLEGVWRELKECYYVCGEKKGILRLKRLGGGMIRWQP